VRLYEVRICKGLVMELIRVVVVCLGMAVVEVGVSSGLLYVLRYVCRREAGLLPCNVE